MTGDLRQQNGIVVHDRHGVASADLGGGRLARPFPHGLLQRLTDAGVGPGPHQPAEALDVAREDTEGARRDGAVFARCPSPPAAITHDIDPVDTSEIPGAQATDHV